MKHRVKATFKGIAFYVVCPICAKKGDHHEQALNQTMPWCATCGCEYKITPRGATFDTALKTDAWGKTLNLSGGIRLSSAEKKKP